MSWDVNEHVYDLEEIKKGKKTFKDVIDMKTAKKPELVRVKNDISGQVVYSEKGSNVVVTAYDTQEVTYKMISTTISSEKETSGKNKGKYKVTTITYNATYDEDGDVNGYDEGVEKITYSKKAGTGVEEVVYQTINSKNKVIATSDVDVEGQNKIIVNRDKVLGTVTCKNGEGSDNDLYLDSADIDEENLFYLWYAPQKSGKKYTGTWLQEEVDSTSANETFNLGVNRDDLDSDEINYDMELAGGHGKDTVALVKDSRVNIALENDGGLIKTFTKSGNNVTMALGKSSDYDGNPDYKKEIMTVTKKSGDNYNVNTKIYVWNEDLNEGDGGYELVSDETDVWPHESIVLVAKQMKKDYGVDFHVGTNVYYLDEDFFMYQGGEESLAKVTFKNYLKLAQDGVTLNDESLKEILEGATGVGILGNSESTKKQKLTGTFLNETFNGGSGKDTISTGTGTDTVTAGGGNDTITLADGEKTLIFAEGDGNDTVKGVENADKVTIDLGEDVRSSWFTKSGNDLIVNRLYGAYQLNGNTEEIPETVTISNYFKKENYDKSNIEISYKNIEGNMQKIEDLTAAFKEYEGEVIVFDNAKSKAKSITGSDLSDYIIAGRKTTKINALEGHNEIIFALDGKSPVTAKAGSGNDCYTVSNMGVSHDIYDAGGDYDYLHLAPGEFVADYYGLEPTEWQAQYTPDDFVFVFDVMADGQTATKKNDLTSLHIVYSQNYESYNTTMAERLTKYGAKGLLNTANIHDYFKSDGTKGTGTIETIVLNGESDYYYSFSDFDKVRTAVVGWLAEHNQYSSAMDVIQSKNGDDITSLLNVYASVTPQEPQ